MRIRVTVDFDDGQFVTRHVDVDSAGNPKFWSQGVREGLEKITGQISNLVESVYGKAENDGIHLVKD